jgi:long-subunit fatty acid transport protein
MSRDMSIAILEAMGAPVDNAQSVSISFENKAFVTLTVTYSADPQWLVDAGQAVIAKQAQEDKTVASLTQKWDQACRWDGLANEFRFKGDEPSR